MYITCHVLVARDVYTALPTWVAARDIYVYISRDFNVSPGVCKQHIFVFYIYLYCYIFFNTFDFFSKLFV